MALKTEKEIFEAGKSEFQNLYGQPWNKDIALYTQYLQTRYLRIIFSEIESGISGIRSHQRESDMTLHQIKNAIEDLKRKGSN